MFFEKLKSLSIMYDKSFNPLDLSLLQKITKCNVGCQLHYTFLSIITSVNYTSLFNSEYINDIYFNRDIQNFYISFISSLNKSISEIKSSHLFSQEIIGDLYFNKIDILMSMRCTAWEAAKKYVAISLIDRELNTLYSTEPNALKFTIHGKVNEFHFISTSKKDISATAQHFSGGLYYKNNEPIINYKYRIERDHRKETAVYLLQDNSCSSFNPMNIMFNSNQPIYYISE